MNSADSDRLVARSQANLGAIWPRDCRRSHLRLKSPIPADSPLPPAKSGLLHTGQAAPFLHSAGAGVKLPGTRGAARRTPPAMRRRARTMRSSPPGSDRPPSIAFVRLIFQNFPGWARSLFFRTTIEGMPLQHALHLLLHLLVNFRVLVCLFKRGTRSGILIEPVILMHERCSKLHVS